jgi:hypothetical protein
MKRILAIAVFALLLVLNVTHSAQAGRIVVTNDEWTLSNFGFSQGGTQPGQFALNVANWFSGSTGSFLVYSTNFGLTESSLSSLMTGNGYSWTIDTPSNPSLSYLQGFNAVFLAGNPIIDNSILTAYVNGGGNVFLEGGTAVVNEPVAWNAFLNAFGLAYGPSYNSIGGVMAINSPHPIFTNVSFLYQNSGNDTLDLSASDPRGQVLVTYTDTAGAQHGLYAVYDSGSTAVPEPTTMLLLGIGLVGLAGVRRKCKK